MLFDYTSFPCLSSIIASAKDGKTKTLHNRIIYKCLFYGPLQLALLFLGSGNKKLLATHE
jgi:hypothetical protein